MACMNYPDVPEISRIGTARIPGVPALPIRERESGWMPGTGPVSFPPFLAPPKKGALLNRVLSLAVLIVSNDKHRHVKAEALSVVYLANTWLAKRGHSFTHTLTHSTH